MIAQLNPNDLNALSTILYYYERYLWNTVAPSAKRSQQSAEIQLLTVKLTLLPTAKAMVLTFCEVDYINAALTIFTTQITKKIPQSKSRDNVLESCEQLRIYITTAFAPK